MSHAHTPPDPRARLRLARLVVDAGWPVARVAERYDASWPAAKRWADRYRQLGAVIQSPGGAPDNVDLDAAVAKVGTVIAAYASRDDRPDLPFWPLLFDNVTLRLLGSDDFPAAAKQQAAAELTAAAAARAVSVAVGEPLPLEQAAEAHNRVDTGTRERVLLAVDR